MYQSQENPSTSRSENSLLGLPLPSDAEIEAAILRASKMRSAAFWNVLKAVGRPFRTAVVAIRKYFETQRAVAALRQMDRHLLSDIGLAPGDVDRAVVRGREHKPAAAFKATTVVANDSGTTREAA